MNKRQLIELITRLPDNLECMPFEIKQDSVHEEDWIGTNEKRQYGGVYERKVNHEMRLDLRFVTRQEAEFRRSYEDPEGVFRNLRTIPC